MSDAPSWYARKFGGQRPQSQRPPPGYIPQQQQQPQAFAQFQGQQIPVQMPKVTTENLWGAMLQWRGGKAHRIDADPCPECGSARYYSRTGEGTMRGPPPAPHCFDCGYNGMFQQGLPTSWQPG